MAKLTWDATGAHLYETGVDHVVLYKALDSAIGGPGENGYGNGVAWNGVTGITETPSGGEETKLWADNIKYLSLRSAEDYGATITAYTYPDAWAECDGSAYIDVAGAFGETGGVLQISQQPRKGFCLAFRTIVGNDTAGNDYGYKLHILYGCTTSPSEKTNSTVNESPEANEFSWEVSTQPVDPKITISGKALKPTGRIVIDAYKITTMEDGQGKTDAIAKLTEIENNLFGTDTSGSIEGITPHVLMPNQIYAILTGTQVSG